LPENPLLRIIVWLTELVSHQDTPYTGPQTNPGTRTAFPAAGA
jgi:hypothetical protein